ncbi:M48 family metallopeptidase [Fulvivirga sediminis]|uniref:M48 family metallopeptidase n=1 Tax=Fulvivirga sediminis TaxID=2803949 RepID=A0A937K0Q8_9BACT|nr:M48 family metallopeptidase [Fulvivirga sediminis]MBL3657864.1 M48 family metallopeptidase [Fulvivirga sediminis]
MKYYFFNVLIACCLTVAGCTSLYAQNGYTTLLPEGYIPSDFTQSFSLRYLNSTSSISKEDKRYVRKGKKKFYLKSSYSINDFLLSGKVLFNDPISNYLNAILAEVSKNDPDIDDSKVHVYAVKSAIPNAFATNSGIIFVNIGLITKLQNEAQLAFILSHEATHYKKKHVINNYIKNIEITEGKGSFRKFSNDEQNIAKSSYSKELEIEADSEGLISYIKSNYAKDSSLIQVFDILQTSDQLLLDQPFEYEFFEHGEYIFPDDYKVTDFEEYTSDEDYDDSESTHPNTAKRKENIKTLLNKYAVDGGTKYIISKNSFDNTKKLATLELCRQFLLNHDYDNALYLGYSLLSEYPDEKYFIEKVIGKAMYGITYREGLNPDKVVVSKEIQKIRHLYNEMSEEERKIWAIQYLYKIHLAHPEDEEVKLMIEDCIARLVKVDKTMRDKLFKNGTDKWKQAYYTYAFSEFDNQSALKQWFEKYTPTDKTESKKKRRRKKKKQKGPKVSKTILANPSYIKINKKKKDAARYADSEDVLEDLGKKINKVSSKLSMKVDQLDMSHLGRNDVETFNDNAIVNEWLGEKFIGSDTSMVSPIHNEVIRVADKHNTPYLTWIGAITMKDKVHDKGYAIALALLAPSLIPYTIVHLLSPEKETLYISFTMDVKSGQLVSSDIRSMQIKDSKSLMHSNLYNTFFKLKHGRK